MAATKEDIINDINIITTLSSKQDMSLPSNAQKYRNYYVQKKSFKTGIGQQYLERLNQIAERSNPDTCFVCKKNKAYDGILCENCMQKYTRGTKDFYKEPEQDLSIVLDEAFNDIKPEMPSFSSASASGNVVKPTNNYNPSEMENNQQKNGTSMRGKTSGLAIVAFVFSIFMWPLSIIFSIIDLSKKDGRKKGLSTVALIISFIWVIAIGYAYNKNNNTNSKTKNEEPEYVSSDIDNSNLYSSADSVGNIITADFANVEVTPEQLMDLYKDSWKEKDAHGIWGEYKKVDQKQINGINVEYYKVYSSDGGLLATMNIGTNEKGNVTGFILAHPSKDSPDAVIVVSEYMFSAMLKKIIPQLGDDSEQEVKDMFSRSTPFKTDYEYENNTTLETAETADYYIGIKHGFLGEGYYCELHVEDRDTVDYLMSLQ